MSTVLKCFAKAQGLCKESMLKNFMEHFEGKKNGQWLFYCEPQSTTKIKISSDILKPIMDGHFQILFLLVSL